MALVAGVGLGIFLIALALGLAIFGVLAAQKSKRSVPIQAAILALLVLVCVLVTLATRKAGPDAGLETEVEGYDYGAIVRVVVFVLMLLGIVVGAVGTLVTYGFMVSGRRARRRWGRGGGLTRAPQKKHVT